MIKSEHFDSCCPVEKQFENRWLRRLQKEKKEIIDELTEKKFILKTLSHSMRLTILFALGIRPHCVCELIRKLEAKNSTVSYHLSYLVTSSLIIGKNRAGRAYYQLTPYAESVLDWLKDFPSQKEE